MNKARIGVAKTPEEIRRCHPVMVELRAHLQDVDQFVEQVTRQQRDGYQIAYLEADCKICAVAGYRILESLFSGKFLYVDDLVTRARDRSLGFGGQLLDWLLQEACKSNCAALELDSGVQRFDAHRFYFLKRMHISSYHFRLKTGEGD